MKGINPCDGFRCTVCGVRLSDDLQGNPNPTMCHECADAYVGRVHRELETLSPQSKLLTPAEAARQLDLV